MENAIKNFPNQYSNMVLDLWMKTLATRRSWNGLVHCFKKPRKIFSTLVLKDETTRLRSDLEGVIYELHLCKLK